MDKQTNFHLLTSAGTFPLFNSTRVRICLRPTGTRLKCSTGLPLLLLRPGRTTQTLGRVPCPKRSNSSTLVLIVGVTLNPAERREQGGRSQQQKTTGAVTVIIYSSYRDKKGIEKLKTTPQWHTQSFASLPSTSLHLGLKHNTVMLHCLRCEGDNSKRVREAGNAQCCHRQVKDLNVSG